MGISGCAGAENALVKECLTSLQQLPAAGGFFDFLIHQDGRKIPASWEAFDKV